MRCSNSGCNRDPFEGDPPTIYQFHALTLDIRAALRGGNPVRSETGLYCSKACLIEDISR